MAGPTAAHPWASRPLLIPMVCSTLFENPSCLVSAPRNAGAFNGLPCGSRPDHYRVLRKTEGKHDLVRCSDSGEHDVRQRTDADDSSRRSRDDARALAATRAHIFTKAPTPLARGEAPPNGRS